MASAVTQWHSFLFMVSTLRAGLLASADEIPSVPRIWTAESTVDASVVGHAMGVEAVAFVGVLKVAHARSENLAAVDKPGNGRRCRSSAVAHHTPAR